MKKTALGILSAGFAFSAIAVAADPSYYDYSTSADGTADAGYDYSYSAKADYGYSAKGAKAPLAPAPLDPIPCFTAGEIQLDAFALYANPKGNGILSDGWGGGIGGSYFLNEYVGLMGRAYWWDADPVIHSITGSAILRYPFQSLCLAPYAYGGIGGHFDSVNQVGAHLGVGLEFRMTENIGVFADWNYTWADETEDWDVISFGLRFVF